ncbi:dihydrolipoamide acetyltransferase family protein [Salegentibacter flavus]|uniref:Dihydrolipoamide acetyltransferase component of pyruvate dehydrogenase complex n=1 Tax=Salegentibacter flavus TaxID=287099 RepID=A0A1I5B8B3_9FLAO|nr:dihydrolipoamide acetyltransferase family protein [Salegentibacter flavus]SFN70870.1 pyruvate dehydrogenase E2 component (dihydrolipoamide acetyltransferase) [Salegentibacter flavus]
MTEFLMPSLGADMEAGTLVEWKKKPGDQLKPGDIIAEVETQKGLIEIEVFEAGILEDYLIEEGDKVPVGAPMAKLKSEGTPGKIPEKDSETHPIQEKEQATESEGPVPSDSISEETSSKEKSSEEKHRIKASPLARSIAEKNNVDLTSLTGTGEGGAITKADVEQAMAGEKETPKQSPETTAVKDTVEKKAEQETPSKQVMEPPAPSSKPGQQESIRAAVAAAMSRSNREIPHYYLEKKIDMLAAMSWLKDTNRQREISGRLLPAVLFIKAVAKAIDSTPALNAVWDNGLQLKNEVNIGFVISLRAGGLLVPAIRNADTKNVDEIMTALNDMIPRARALKLRSSELSDSTITITSLGENGAEKVFGVIYPPQVAIVGFGSIVNEPLVHDGMLAVRPVLHVTLAGDHRATDGLTGSRFLEALNNHLQNPEKL